MGDGAILNLGGEYVPPIPGLGDKPASINLGGGEVAGPSIPHHIVSSITSGLTDIPLAGALFEKALTGAVGVDPATLEEMARTSNSTPYGKGLRFITEIGGEMLLGGGIWSLGRRAAVAGLRAAVPQGMAALAAPTATGGRMATGFGQVAARGMDQAGGSPALQRLGIQHAVPKPVVERGAEILGGSAGIGGLYGADALEQGKDPNEAMRVALMSAGLAAGFETALTVGAKALFPGARERDIGKLLAKTEGNPLYRKQIQTELDTLTDRFNAMQGQLAALHDVPNPNLEAIGKLMLKQQVEKPKLLNEINALTLFNDMSPLFRQYLRNTPRESSGALQTFLLKFAKTPEQLAGELGPAAAKVVKMAQNAQLETTMARSFNNVELREIDRLARTGLGVARRHKGQYMMEAADSWQRTGSPVTPRTKDAASLEQAFAMLAKSTQESEHAMARVGLLPPRDTSLSKLKNQLPIVLNRLTPTEDLLGKLIGRPKSPETLTKQLEAALIKHGTNSADAYGLAHRAVFGTIGTTPFKGVSSRTVWSMYEETSLNQLFEGRTFKEIVELGAPIINDPIVAMEAWSNSVARRVAYTKAFGVNGRLAKGAMRRAARAQGTSIQLYDNLVDAVTGGSYGSVAEQAAAGAIVNTQTATRMGLAVLPNAVQGINIPLLTGPSAFVRGLFSRFQQGPIREAAEASAISDSLIRGWRESFLDPYTRTPPGKFSDAVLLFSQFTATERWNRAWAFHAAANYGTKTLVQGVQNKLRGSTLDLARRRFNGMGMDFDDLVRAAKGYDGTPSERVNRLLMGAPDPRTKQPSMSVLKEMAMGGVRQTQFLPDKTRLPTFWSTPGGRIMFQFKSFALNQARLIRDQVISEAARGNMQPLLMMGAGFPLAGELVNNLRQIIKEGELNRPSSPIKRMVENLAAVGGFGLAGDLYRAAAWGPEQLYRSLVGPTIEDAAYGLNAIVSQDFDRVRERAATLPTFSAAWNLGTAGLGWAMEGVLNIKPALDYWQSESGAEAEAEQGQAPTLQELQAQQRPQ